jgi:hypothetical protein
LTGSARGGLIGSRCSGPRSAGRETLIDLERVVDRFEWEVVAFVILSNHLHLLLKTPCPNLGKGMQGFLSA